MAITLKMFYPLTFLLIANSIYCLYRISAPTTVSSDIHVSSATIIQVPNPGTAYTAAKVQLLNNV
jgi:hypothetical protein